MKLVKKINILGTQYSVYRVKANENEYMTKMNYGGMCVLPMTTAFTFSI